MSETTANVVPMADLSSIMARRAAGEKWHDIAKGVGVSASTIRGRLVRAGFMQKGTRVRKVNKAKTTGATTLPVRTELDPELAAAVAAANAAAKAAARPFVPPSWYPLLRYAMKSERGACLFGPRGCGKSTTIRELARELGREAIPLQCAANMQIDSLLGSWTSENGTLRFIDGPLTEAVRRGAWLMAEEANVIHPGVWSVVNTLTDTTGDGLRLPTGEVVPQSEGFRLILLYNEGYSGTRDVNAALKDRLMPIFADYLDPAHETELIEKLTGATNAEATQVVGVANMIRQADIGFDLSPRSLVRWVRLVRDEGMTWRAAFDKAIIDLVGPPHLAAAQRGCVDEIGRNTVDQWAAVETRQ